MSADDPHRRHAAACRNSSAGDTPAVAASCTTWFHCARREDKKAAVRLVLPSLDPVVSTAVLTHRVLGDPRSAAVRPRTLPDEPLDLASGRHTMEYRAAAEAALPCGLEHAAAQSFVINWMRAPQRQLTSSTFR